MTRCWWCTGGLGEPRNRVRCHHLHTDRAGCARVADQVRAFAPDAVIDTLAMSEADRTAVFPHLPDVPLVALSSMDVHEAYEPAPTRTGRVRLPLTERSTVRRTRYPYRGRDVRGPEGYGLDVHRYDKLDVEPHHLARGGTCGWAWCTQRAIRSGARNSCCAGCARDAGSFRSARAACCGPGCTPTTWHAPRWRRWILRTRAARSSTSGEAETFDFRDWMRRILDAVGSDAELVRVANAVLPPDLALSAAPRQHLLFDSGKAARPLGGPPTAPPTPSPGPLGGTSITHLWPPTTISPEDDHALTRSAESSA